MFKNININNKFNLKILSILGILILFIIYYLKFKKNNVELFSGIKEYICSDGTILLGGSVNPCPTQATTTTVPTTTTTVPTTTTTLPTTTTTLPTTTTTLPTTTTTTLPTTTRPIIDCVGSFVNGICLPSNDLNLMCGPGTQTQKYEISQQAENGGIQCTYSQDQEQIVPCNLAPCPINCVGSFGTYGSCTKSCGGGKKERVYTITTAAQHGGISCPNKDGDKEVIDCNTQACPITCEGEFVDFKPCSKDCGTDGILLKTYDITKKAQYGGLECPNEQNDIVSIPCNRQPCPTYPENTAIQEALKDSNNKIQNIRYDIITPTEKKNETKIL